MSGELRKTTSVEQATPQRRDLDAFAYEFSKAPSNRKWSPTGNCHCVFRRVASIPESATLVYDQHNVIYAYGPLAKFQKILLGEGLSESPITFPAPHAHNYNPEYDDHEQKVLDYWNWRKSPLMTDDEA